MWRAQFAYTYVDATYSDAYRTCVAAPCATPTALVPVGNRLPGVPKSNAYANLRWGNELGFHLGANGQYVSAVAVNDQNTVFTPSYALFGADAGYGTEVRSSQVNTFLRANNIFNRHYVGSVIVSDGNGRFFEPGAGFNLLAGISITMK